MPSKISTLKNPDQAYKNLKKIMVMLIIINCTMAGMYMLGAQKEDIMNEMLFILLTGVFLCCI